MKQFSLLSLMVIFCLLAFSRPGHAESECQYGVCFSFPSPDNSLFYAPGLDGFGPFLMDHKMDGDHGYCRNYEGQDFDNCYAEHRGSDFMLKGGFRKMQENVPVTAAASGEVVYYNDTNYDMCRGSLAALLQSAKSGTGDGITCGWYYDRQARKMIKRPIANNYIRMRHWNGREYIYSLYFHIRTNSVPKSIRDHLPPKTQCTSNCPKVECGELLAYVGSAGISTAPHIHFEVRSIGDNYKTAIDPYYGDFLATQCPSRTMSMWTSQNDSAELPAVACQEPYTPGDDNDTTSEVSCPLPN